MVGAGEVASDTGRIPYVGSQHSISKLVVVGDLNGDQMSNGNHVQSSIEAKARGN